MWNFPLHPDRASSLALHVDILLYAWLALAGVVTVAVLFLIVWFAVKYRHGSGANRALPPDAALRRRNHRIEAAWIVTPLLLFMVMFGWAAVLYYAHAAAPANATEIYVVGKQWMWKLEHVGGQREIDELHVPLGVPVRLTMTSQDVIHSLYLPALRIKQDVLPGRYTQEWFVADRPGTYPLRCAEYCGTDHSVMGGRLIVMPRAAFAAWLAQAGADRSMAERGRALYDRLGCAGCHGANAQGGQSPVRAPALAGLYGSPVPLADGTIVTADDQYVHDSIMLPNKQVAAGYAPVMPPFGTALDESQVSQLEAFIRSLGAAKDQP